MTDETNSECPTAVLMDRIWRRSGRESGYFNFAESAAYGDDDDEFPAGHPPSSTSDSERDPPNHVRQLLATST